MALAVGVLEVTRPGVALATEASLLHGRVVQSANVDGGLAGVEGVLVSNGREVVRSDARGAFQLEVMAGDTAFVIRPAGFDVPAGDDGLPRFWRHHFPTGVPLHHGGMATRDATASHWEVMLTASGPAAGRDEVLVFGDPQPKSMVDVGHYRRDIIEPVIGKHPAVLGLTLGDVVHGSALELLPALNEATVELGIPWLHAAGNHDVDADATHDRHSLLGFRSIYGPDTFAWEASHARFVVLDNVVHLPEQGGAYVGGLREDQFAFLEAYLDQVDDERLLVIAAHIPFFDTQPGRETFRRADRERLFALLSRHPHVLLLSAHGHVQRHHFHAADAGWRGQAPLHEFNIGAACGGFWGGVPDATGIPDAAMSDGTPNGYAVLGVAAGGRYDLRWYAAREPDDHAIALHAPRVLRQGAWPGVYLYANVFMGIQGDRVEARIGGGAWQAMTRVERMDPRILTQNLLDDAADELRGFDRTPEARESTHLWRIALPTDLAAGEHRIEVRALDRWRGELRATTAYRLDAD